MKKTWIIIGMIVILACLAIGVISFGCQDGWCYIFPWQKHEQILVPPTETFTPYEATLEGEYTCLLHKNSSGPQTMECALGMKAADGLFYGLDTSGLAGGGSGINTATGTKIRVTGTVVPVSDQSQKYNIRGTVKVKTFEKL